ncbi:MAG: hypothetical protein KDI13_11180 [Alphaproteobacteria bacterium]|nr:hypothetical protein [Alphaproteobacteria bacterium]
MNHAQKYKELDITKSVQTYKRITHACAILHYLTFISTFSIFGLPLALLFRRMLIAFDHLQIRALKWSRLFVYFLYIPLIVALSILCAYYEPYLNEALHFVLYMGYFAGFIMGHLILITPLIKGVRAAIKAAQDSEYIHAPYLSGDYRLLSIIGALFKGSHFVQPSLFLRSASYLFYFLSTLLGALIFSTIFITFILPVVDTVFSYDYIQPNRALREEAVYEIMSERIGFFGGLAFGLFILCLITGLAISGLRSIGDIINRKNIDEYRKVDPRNPILFLRSFQHKKVKLGKTRFSFVFRALTGEFLIRHLDYLLEKRFWNIGPVYSVADPDKNWGRLSGTIKQVYAHDNWFEAIKKMIQDSVMVVISPGKTKSVQDEISYIENSQNLNKTIFLFTKKNKFEPEYTEFLPGIKDWGDADKKSLPFHTTRALIYDQTVPCILSTKKCDPFTFVYCLNYFLKQRGLLPLPHPVKPLNKKFILILILLSLLWGFHLLGLEEDPPKSPASPSFSKEKKYKPSE